MIDIFVDYILVELNHVFVYVIFNWIALFFMGLVVCPNNGHKPSVQAFNASQFDGQGM